MIDIEKYIAKEEDCALNGYEVGDKVTIGIVPYKEISYKFDSGYGAYCVEQIMETDEMPETFKISGNFLNQLNVGQTYEATGEVVIYNKKKQLKVSEIKKITPKTDRTIKSFLKSLEGMGPFSDLIYEEYGERAFDVIRNTPMELKKVAPAIYDALALSWQKQLLEIKDNQEYLTQLMNFGLKPIQAKNFYDLYKELCIEKIKENPYRLAKELSGFGFIKCDTIAKNLGFPINSPKRIEEALIYVLSMTKFDGNTFLYTKELEEKVNDLLAIKLPVREMKAFYKTNKTHDKAVYKVGNISFNIDMKDIENAIEEYNKCSSKFQKEQAKIVIFNIENKDILHGIEMLRIEGRIIVDGDKIYDKSLYLDEDVIARKLVEIEHNKKPITVNIKSALDNYLDKKNIELETNQYQAVIDSASFLGGFSIINGSAGCGKTFSLKIAIKMIKAVYMKEVGYFEPIILAPTGRAAKVAANATGLETSTIHKILRFGPQTGFFFNSRNNLPYNCVIVDETSMLDVEIAKSLLEAVSIKTKVIFVGDAKQLASVGPGNVLKDIINSNKFKVTTLTVAKRAGKDSGIYKNATRIIEGCMITTEKETGDAFIYKSTDNMEIVKKTLKLYEKLFSQLNLEDIEVLVPQKSGLLGTNYLNFILQEKFNPDNNEYRILNKVVTVSLGSDAGKYELYFKKGDKIIHTQNNYLLPWYQSENGNLVLDENGLCGVSNGETGRIVKIMQSEDENRNRITRIIVKYDEKYIIYTNDFSQIDHAYAMTIHKSQGSEWPAVIIPINFSSYRMLEKNLIYTGYTRARRLIAMIGDPEAIFYAIKTEKAVKRNTGLKDRILEIS